MNDALEHFRFHEAAHVVYHFFWGDFCDWYIEWVKPELLSPDRTKSAATWKNLFAAFESALRLLHPFMPFITEELWHQLPQREGARSIALDRFPEPHAERIDAASEEQVALLQEIISSARNIRAEMKLDQKAKLPAQLGPATRSCPVHRGTQPRYHLAACQSFFPFLCQAAFRFDEGRRAIDTRISSCSLPYEAAIDVPAELARLRKELDRLTKDIASKQSRLEDQTFRSRAPEHIVKGLESTLAERRTELEKLKERLAQLEKNL